MVVTQETHTGPSYLSVLVEARPLGSRPQVLSNQKPVHGTFLTPPMELPGLASRTPGDPSTSDCPELLHLLGFTPAWQARVPTTLPPGSLSDRNMVGWPSNSANVLDKSLQLSILLTSKL